MGNQWKSNNLCRKSLDTFAKYVGNLTGILWIGKSQVRHSRIVGGQASRSWAAQIHIHIANRVSGTLVHDAKSSIYRACDFSLFCFIPAHFVYRWLINRRTCIFGGQASAWAAQVHIHLAKWVSETLAHDAQWRIHGTCDSALFWNSCSHIRKGRL